MRRKPLFPPPKAATGKQLRHKGRQPFSVLTVNGRVRLKRVRWYGKGEGTQTPIDQMLDEAEQVISEGVREMACRLNRSSPSFQMTSENLYRTAHIQACKETLRVLIEGEGRKILEAQRRGELAPDWKATDCRVPSSVTTRVYVGADGVMVPIITDEEKQVRRKKIKEKRRRSGKKCRPLPARKIGADQSYKEFKLVTLYDEEQKRRYVAGTRGDHAAAGRMMQRMSIQIGLQQADEKIANIDGSPWIRNEIQFYGIVDVVGLDYYHLREYVQKTRLAVYGQNESTGEAWKEEIMSLFYKQGYDATWERLVAWRHSLEGAKREAADQLLGYVAERREMIRYPEFLNRGWQIGSGPTEAQCGTATQRIKGRGRRWDQPNAEAIMAIDCLENSHAWNVYWTTLDVARN